MSSKPERVLRVDRHFERVPDFERDEKGQVKHRFFPGKSPHYGMEAREQMVREYLIAIEQGKMIREELRECYMREGVNHYENCKELASKYWDVLNTRNYGALNGDYGPSKPFDGSTHRSFEVKNSDILEKE